jgi:hypothetical protein
MSAKAGKSSAPHCGHLLTNNLFIGISSTPQLFLNFWMATRCDARHTKNLESMAEMKLQQAAAKLVSKEEDRAQYRKLRELLRNLFCSIVAKHHSFELS